MGDLQSLVSKTDPYILFSIKVENNDSPLFLDVLFSKHKNLLSVAVFGKIFTEFLPPHVLFSHPFQQKMAASYTYTFHALHIFSETSDLSFELNYLQFLAASQG